MISRIPEIMKIVGGIVARIRFPLIVTPRPLGRWALEYQPDKLHRKIDSSNEDHCGPCGVDVLPPPNVRDTKPVP